VCEIECVCYYVSVCVSDPVACFSASAALALSDIPWNGPIGECAVTLSRMQRVCVCVCDAPLCFRSGARRPRRRRVPHQPHALGDERQQTQPGDRRSPVQPSGSVRAQQRYPSCPALSHCVCVCVCVCV